MHSESTEHISFADLEDEWKSNPITGCTLIRVLPHSICNITLEELETQNGLLKNCNGALIVQRNANPGMQRLQHNLAGDLHDRVLRSDRNAAGYLPLLLLLFLLGVVAFAVGKWKTTCRVLLSPLVVLPYFHFSLSPLSVCSVSRVSCAALVAARHALRRPRAERKCGPLSTRNHQAFRHHVMSLFDTWLSSCTE